MAEVDDISGHHFAALRRLEVGLVQGADADRERASRPNRNRPAFGIGQLGESLGSGNVRAAVDYQAQSGIPVILNQLPTGGRQDAL